MTKATISKWGDSVAIRVPKAIAAAMHPQEGDVVNLQVVGGRPRSRSRPAPWRRLWRESLPRLGGWGLRTRPNPWIGGQTLAQSALTIMIERLFVAGDVVIVNLDPAKGSEQSGIRRALVIASVVMDEVSKRVVVCPITRNMSNWPTKIRIPEGHKTIGMVLADQVRSLDYLQHVLRSIEILPLDFVLLVRSYVGRLLDLELPFAGR